LELNREIIEAIKQIEREKGIDAETLLIALEDALLAAYKKTPDAAEHARVEIDRESGDIRVFQLLPPEGEALRTLPQPDYEILRAWIPRSSSRRSRRSTGTPTRTRKSTRST
jgi:hypothetical protein